MEDTYVFTPPLRTGMLAHAAGIAGFVVLGGWGLWHIAHVQISPEFIFFFTPVALALFFIPLLGYRMYAMKNASYILDRDSIRLNWGFRQEIIAMNEVNWIQQVSPGKDKIPLPLLRFPGAILGHKHLANDKTLEFFATQTDPLFLIDTPKTTFAISPGNPEAFTNAYRALIELGSLEPPRQQSVLPAFLFARIWQKRPARYLILVSFVLGLALFVWAAFAITTRSRISLGFRSTGGLRSPIPAIRLMLLPLLNGFTFFINFLAGAFFFREEKNRFFAYLLWGSSAVTALLYLIAMGLILHWQ